MANFRFDTAVFCFIASYELIFLVPVLVLSLTTARTCSSFLVGNVVVIYMILLVALGSSSILLAVIHESVYDDLPPMIG